MNYQGFTKWIHLYSIILSSSMDSPDATAILLIFDATGPIALHQSFYPLAPRGVASVAMPLWHVPRSAARRPAAPRESATSEVAIGDRVGSLQLLERWT